MYLLKIISFCMIGTLSFAMEEETDASLVPSDTNTSTVPNDSAQINSAPTTSDISQTGDSTLSDQPVELTTPSTEQRVWLGNLHADALITTGMNKVNDLIDHNQQLRLIVNKFSPYVSNALNAAEKVDQKMLLTFIAGSVLSQNDYLYPVLLLTSACCAEKSLGSIADTWRTSSEEKKPIFTFHGVSLNERELLVTAGLLAILLDRDIYSATFLAMAYGTANFTRDNKDKLFDVGSFLAYMILLNELYSVNI